MGFFRDILEKLGIGSANAGTPDANKPSAKTTLSPPATRPGTAAPPTAPKPVAVVDVVAKLEQLAKASPQKLNWKTSIVDLLKLLDIDSGLAARKELAKELNAPASAMGESAGMNIWLHKAVLARVAANGGNVPKDLLD